MPRPCHALAPPLAGSVQVLSQAPMQALLISMTTCFFGLLNTTLWYLTTLCFLLVPLLVRPATHTLYITPPAGLLWSISLSLAAGPPSWQLFYYLFGSWHNHPSTLACFCCTPAHHLHGRVEAAGSLSLQRHRRQWSSLSTAEYYCCQRGDRGSNSTNNIAALPYTPSPVAAATLYHVT